MKRFIPWLLAAGLLTSTAFAGESCCKPQAACCQPAQECCVHSTNTKAAESAATTAIGPTILETKTATDSVARENPTRTPTESGDCCAEGQACCAEGADCCSAN